MQIPSIAGSSNTHCSYVIRAPLGALFIWAFKPINHVPSPEPAPYRLCVPVPPDKTCNFWLDSVEKGPSAISVHEIARQTLESEHMLPLNYPPLRAARPEQPIFCSRQAHLSKADFFWKVALYLTTCLHCHWPVIYLHFVHFFHRL